MNIIIGVFLIVHGFAHLVGFIVSWRLANLEDAPYKTTLIAGKIDVGNIGIRIIGIFWFLAALAFFACGVGVFAQFTWWPNFTFIVTSISLILSILGWPDSWIGIVVNIIIIIFIPLASKLEWISV
jgi:nicotinamide riboside transporter PnuC